MGFLCKDVAESWDAWENSWIRDFKVVNPVNEKELLMDLPWSMFSYDSLNLAFSLPPPPYLKIAVLVLDWKNILNLNEDMHNKH